MTRSTLALLIACILSAAFCVTVKPATCQPPPHPTQVELRYEDRELLRRAVVAAEKSAAELTEIRRELQRRR